MEIQRRRIELVLVTLLLVAVGCSNAEWPSAEKSPAATAAATSTTIGAHGLWTAMAEPPLSVGPGAPAVWTGDELIIWGGSSAKGETLVTGASYDPDTDEWTELPTPPSKPRQGHVAVWSGEEVLIWGGVLPQANHGYADGIAYRPADRTWRTIADAPVGSRVEAQAFWTGKEMIVAGGIPPGLGGSPTEESETVAYDPATDRWRKLRAGPPGGPGKLLARTDTELLFFNPILGETRGEAARVTPFDIAAGRWGTPREAPLPARPPPPSQELAGTCSHGYAVTAAQVGQWSFLWKGSCTAGPGFAYSLADGTWSRTIDLPLMQNVQAVAGGKTVYLIADVPTGVDIYQYHQSENALIRSAHPDVDIAPGADALWTGEKLLIFNGTRGIDQPRPGAAFTPQPPLDPAPASPIPPA